MIALLTATFLTAGVEWVEAYTIVLAVAVTVGWRRAGGAALAGFAALGALTMCSATLLPHLGNPAILQFVIGAFLVLFGTRWLGKAVARGAGLKQLHDEDTAFAGLLAHPGIHETRTAWLIAFNGVLLEGLEVWLIVVALGVQTHHLIAVGLTALAALAAVAAAGFAMRKPLSRIPENTIKFAAGAGILGFGTFWVLASLGYAWPLGDFSLPALFAFYLGGGLLLINMSRRTAAA